jgi:apolipoprotein N-acyltransferase
VPSPATLLGLLAGALLLAVYARGGSGWMLGFVALVPLAVGAGPQPVAGRHAGGRAGDDAGAGGGRLFWFGLAIGHFTGLGPAVGLALLVLVAPLLQPQVLVWALLRRAVGRHHGPALGALAAAAGWVGTEWLLLKPLGDTLGHGLYPSTLLRQAADLGGTAGLLRVGLIQANITDLETRRRRRRAATRWCARCWTPTSR